MQNANNALIAQNVQIDSNEYDGCMLAIDCDEQCAGVHMRNITLCVSDDKDDYGVLGVSWDSTRLNNNEVSAVMRAFYWDNEFTARLKYLLLNAGFSSIAVEDVRSSEWGIQYAERASYDARLIVDEMRAAMRALQK